MADAHPTLREWLSEEPFTLGLSSGFFGFFAHAGVLSVLEREQLLPEAICGSSAGALAGGFWAAGVEADAICARLARLRREEFWDPAPGLGLLRGRRFRGQLEALLPVTRFDRCRARLMLSAFDLRTLSTHVLVEGPLAQAIHASCAVPLMFQPVWIAGHPLLDGGLSDRPGLAGLGPSTPRLLFHHLAAKSPWRRHPPEPPVRPAMTPLIISGLPRISPFHLHRAEQAISRAREATLLALDRPVSPGGQPLVI